MAEGSVWKEHEGRNAGLSNGVSGEHGEESSAGRKQPADRGGKVTAVSSGVNGTGAACDGEDMSSVIAEGGSESSVARKSAAERVQGGVVMAVAACVVVSTGFTASIAMVTAALILSAFSPTLSRRITRWFGEAFFSLAPFLLLRWSQMRLLVYGKGDIRSDGQYLLISNHQGNLDWMIGLASAHAFGSPMPGSVKAVIKRSLMFVPIFGWIFWALEFMFLQRSWDRDQDMLRRGGKRLQSYPRPLWMALWPEGTRQTRAKLEESQSFCRKRGFPVLQNLLFPRLKAFRALLQALRNTVDGVLDTTVIFEPNASSSLGTVLTGRASGTIYVFLQTHVVREVVSDSSECAANGRSPEDEWLIRTWVAKDELISRFHQDQTSVLSEYRPVSELFPNVAPSFSKLYILGAMSVGLW
eukprot:CAMPEP_0185844316 /NCGR_PEP_ID=MMETSP1354-20130828/527_1 /TAXON_ID=708628 /ORGANISM="Erythrolobus madagascarensis, Strain CCMP3276" /LENGTH=412 /DNA_ID=CAMNT_0028543957 /DNA_START=21 /DNA_END=1256 /DNA_ORIENTATION=-